MELKFMSYFALLFLYIADVEQVAQRLQYKKIGDKSWS